LLPGSSTHLEIKQKTIVRIEKLGSYAWLNFNTQGQFEQTELLVPFHPPILSISVTVRACGEQFGLELTAERLSRAVTKP